MLSAVIIPPAAIEADSSISDVIATLQTVASRIVFDSFMTYPFQKIALLNGLAPCIVEYIDNTGETQVKYITISKAADLLGVTRIRVHQLIEQYELPVWKPSPRLTMIDKDDVMRLKKMKRPTGKHRT